MSFFNSLRYVLFLKFLRRAPAIEEFDVAGVKVFLAPVKYAWDPRFKQREHWTIPPKVARLIREVDAVAVDRIHNFNDDEDAAQRFASRKVRHPVKELNGKTVFFVGPFERSGDWSLSSMLASEIEEHAGPPAFLGGPRVPEEESRGFIARLKRLQHPGIKPLAALFTPSPGVSAVKPLKDMQKVGVTLTHHEYDCLMRRWWGVVKTDGLLKAVEELSRASSGGKPKLLFLASEEHLDDLRAWLSNPSDFKKLCEKVREVMPEQPFFKIQWPDRPVKVKPLTRVLRRR
ncbi:MAG: hypothetical protein QW343_03770 [Candidatus Norongarragalinales archaeon]